MNTGPKYGANFSLTAPISPSHPSHPSQPHHHPSAPSLITGATQGTRFQGISLIHNKPSSSSSSSSRFSPSTSRAKTSTVPHFTPSPSPWMGPVLNDPPRSSNTAASLSIAARQNRALNPTLATYQISPLTVPRPSGGPSGAAYGIAPAIRFPASRTSLWDETPNGSPTTLAPDVLVPVLQLDPDMNFKSLTGRASLSDSRQLAFHAQLFHSSRPSQVSPPSCVISSLSGPTSYTSPAVTKIPITSKHHWSAALAAAEAKCTNSVLRREPSPALHSDAAAGSIHVPAFVPGTPLVFASAATPYIEHEPSRPLLSLHFWMILPSLNIRLTPIAPLYILPTTLAHTLASGAVHSGPQSGFLSMDQSRKLLPLLSSDPKTSTMPLVGIWVAGPSSPSWIWSAAVRFLTLNRGRLAERVLSPSSSFLVLSYPATSSTGSFTPHLFNASLLTSSAPWTPYTGSALLPLAADASTPLHEISVSLVPLIPRAPSVSMAAKESTLVGPSPSSEVAETNAELWNALRATVGSSVLPHGTPSQDKARGSSPSTSFSVQSQPSSQHTVTRPTIPFSTRPPALPQTPQTLAAASVPKVIYHNASIASTTPASLDPDGMESKIQSLTSSVEDLKSRLASLNRSATTPDRPHDHPQTAHFNTTSSPRHSPLNTSQMSADNSHVLSPAHVPKLDPQEDPSSAYPVFEDVSSVQGGLPASDSPRQAPEEIPEPHYDPSLNVTANSSAYFDPVKEHETPASVSSVAESLSSLGTNADLYTGNLFMSMPAEAGAAVNDTRSSLAYKTGPSSTPGAFPKIAYTLDQALGGSLDDGDSSFSDDDSP